jgi:hypothetical protein
LNASDRTPPEAEHVWDATTLPDIEQVVSLVEKPEPETSTVDPTEPEDGLREIDGTLGAAVVVDDVVVDDVELDVEFMF